MGFEPEPFNTCNGWGFGGGVGTSWKHADGREFRIETAYFRHLPSQKFITLTHREKGLNREDLTDKQFKKLLELN